MIYIFNIFSWYFLLIRYGVVLEFVYIVVVSSGQYCSGQLTDKDHNMGHLLQ